jgi:UDP-glucose 4-epimerase
MAGRSVFITGVAGFLGSHLASHLLEEARYRVDRVIGCDNLSGGYEDNIPAGVEFHRADCNDWERMAALCRGVDVVFHAAATAYEGLSVFSPHFVTQNIVTASSGVFSAAIAAGVRRVVFCSSMARYGTQAVPFTEDLAPRPVDPYGIGKVAAEMMLGNLCEVHGVEHVIAVPHNIYGPRQIYDDPYRAVPAIMVNLMLQGRQPFVYGDGTQRRCFSYVGDVVPCLARLGFDPDVVGEAWNLGPDEEFVTILHLASAIARLLDFDLAPVFVPPRPQEVHLATCSADKARARLGYATRTPLDAGLAELIAYVRARGTRPFRYAIPLEIRNERTPRTWAERLL